MRERPILFSGDMVRAILDGRKTQTRRLLNTDYRMPSTGEILRYQYGVPGDRLWVRETWAALIDEDTLRTQGPAVPCNPRNGCAGDLLAYRADGVADHEWPGFAWRPSIHMPRWASRLTLEITGVRVERLQDINESDALAEGIGMEPRSYDPTKRAEFWFQGCAHPIKGYPKVFPTAVQAYKSLWDSLNTKRAPWSSNPWVWVLEFRRVESAEAQKEAAHV